MRARRPFHPYVAAPAPQVHLHIRHLVVDRDAAGGGTVGDFEGGLALTLASQLVGPSHGQPAAPFAPGVEPVATALAAQVRPLLDRVGRP